MYAIEQIAHHETWLISHGPWISNNVCINIFIYVLLNHYQIDVSNLEFHKFCPNEPTFLSDHQFIEFNRMSVPSTSWITFGYHTLWMTFVFVFRLINIDVVVSELRPSLATMCLLLLLLSCSFILIIFFLKEAHSFRNSLTYIYIENVRMSTHSTRSQLIIQ